MPSIITYSNLFGSANKSKTYLIIIKKGLRIIVGIMIEVYLHCKSKF